MSPEQRPTRSLNPKLTQTELALTTAQDDLYINWLSTHYMNLSHVGKNRSRLVHAVEPLPEDAKDDLINEKKSNGELR